MGAERSRPQLHLSQLWRDADASRMLVQRGGGWGSGLVVALARRAFEILGSLLAELPETADPAADLVEAGVRVFRRFSCDHPSLFRLAVQQTLAPRELTRQARPTANAAFEQLKARVGRLAEAGLVGPQRHRRHRRVHALCEGLAAIELRGMLASQDAEQTWREALAALVVGFAHEVTVRR